MRPILVLSRSVDQLLASSVPRQVCRSCRLRAAGPQRRQLQSSARFGAESSVLESTGTSTSLSKNSQGRYASLGPSTVEEDTDYVEATTWDDLEHVGDARWIEEQRDPQDQYTGWSKTVGNRRYKDEEVEQVLRQTVDEVLSARGQTLPQGSEWSSYRFTDQETKFALVKSLREKSGFKVTDYQWSHARSINDFLSVLLIKPQPKKLATQLRQKKVSTELPNVKISSRRVTPIDKEKAVGRWKVIEQELLERGLPVTGHSR
ncbi:hypothetical protein MBLNU459_g7224t2 [Dothideomycetes sp. NU459]